MINYELIKQSRLALGMSQGIVAEQVTKLAGQTLSQQAYGKIEKGKTKKTSLLPYICHVLQVDLTKADPALTVISSGAKHELLSRVNELSQAERLAIVQDVLAGLDS